MTRLRQLMLDELERRNYSQTTRRAYLLGVEQFAKHFHRSPDQLGLDHIRDYQVYLFRVRKLKPATVGVRLAALRFLYVAVLKRPWTIADTPYPKHPDRLPAVLSQDEVTRLIEAALTPLHRAVLMTLYATGLRRAELTRLKISDIDTARMAIHVLGGKGRKDREVMLSPKLLDALRHYWRGLKRKPRTWLFPAGRWHNRVEEPMTDKVVWYACEQARKRAGIDEFLRRFFLHVLPRGFVRIRHFGFLANRQRQSQLELSRKLLDQLPAVASAATVAKTAFEPTYPTCPACGGTMVIVERFTVVQPHVGPPPDYREVA